MEKEKKQKWESRKGKVWKKKRKCINRKGKVRERKQEKYKKGKTEKRVEGNRRRK